MMHKYYKSHCIRQFWQVYKRKTYLHPQETDKKGAKKNYSEINMFLKQDIDILSDHQNKNHKIELLEDK